MSMADPVRTAPRSDGAPHGALNQGTRIGLISDTHSAGSGRDLPAPVMDALDGVDLILHCGDLECLGVLDYLETIAPVLAVRGYEDPREAGGRLADATRVVDAGGLAIGMIHDIQWPGSENRHLRRWHGISVGRGEGRRAACRQVRPPGRRGAVRRHPRGTDLPLGRDADYQSRQPHLPGQATQAGNAGNRGHAGDKSGRM